MRSPAPVIPRVSAITPHPRGAQQTVAGDTRSQFKTHLSPYFGGMKPSQVTTAVIREFVENRLATKVLRGAKDDDERPTLSSTSVGHMVRSLSTFMSDLVERGLIPANPCRGLPRAT